MQRTLTTKSVRCFTGLCATKRCCFGSKVKDLDRLVVVAAALKLTAAWPGGTPGLGGSSRDKAGTVWYYRTGRVW